MKAVVCHTSGSPDVLKLEEIDKPFVPEDGVLVRVRAFSVNPADLFSLTGVAQIARTLSGRRNPKPEVLGRDFAGTIEAVGKSVTQFQPGDDVFGSRRGAFAEYVCVPQKGAVAGKPVNVTFEQAAAVPVAGITALQGLRDHGQVQPGQRVLINGASGGVGTFAVQIAKALGAHVSAVCSTRNVDLVRSIGADEVIDYTREDFARLGQRYDLLLDIAGNRSFADCRRVVRSNGTLVLVGAPNGLAALSRLLKALLLSRFVAQRLVPFLASVRHEDLVALKEFIEAGTLSPVIDRQYALSEVPDAVRYVAEKHARAKVVITM